MTRRRISLKTGLLIAAAAMLLPLMSSAKAEDSPLCCSDVMFPAGHGHGFRGRDVVIVDGAKEGRGVYPSIGQALKHVRRGGEVLVRPGTYQERALEIKEPVTISNMGGGAVRLQFSGECVTVKLRHGRGKVAINGIAFETGGTSGEGCIVVDRAQEFQLTSSDITVIGDPQKSGVCYQASHSKTANRPKCGFDGVVVHSGAASILGNQIRRTGLAVAIRSSDTNAQRVAGNYLAGNGTGVYVDGGARVVIENNGIFRNHLHGVNLEDASGKVVDNDIEDNRTGLRIVPPFIYRSASASYPGGGGTDDYRDISRPTIVVERNLVTQFGKYAIRSKVDPMDETYMDYKPGETPGKRDSAQGYALEFDVSSFEDGVSDFPDKQGSPLSSIVIRDNCFFGPSTSWFDRDRFMPLIAPTPGQYTGRSGKGKDKDSGYSYSGNGYGPFLPDGTPETDGTDQRSFKRNGFSTHHNDALTPLFDVNTWVEHLDYDAVDRIDHDNSIRSPRYDGFSGGLWTAIHNWFARNKKEMVCTFRFSRPVLSDGGKWSGNTAPRR